MRLATAALFLSLASPALAGDLAEREILGFSPDGNYFAFEEYGVQDGSGFPYSDVFFIETATDSWLPETPIRVLTQNEMAQLADTRFEARELARPFLTTYNIGSPAMVVAINPPTELSADPHVVRFLPRAALPPIDAEFTVTLEEIPLMAASCPEGETYNGFRLTLAGGDGQTRILNEDSTIPQSRACPLRYAISDVITFYPETGSPAVVVMISVFSYGFEGPNRRFLAVVTRL
jgi:predicted secreted protein